MSDSYIPEDTCVICSYMTCGTPMKLKFSRPNVCPPCHSNSKFPLLNKEDKRLSCSFECIVSGSFWGGLEALCAGIAVAALVVVVAASGPIGWAAAALCVGACGVGIFSGGVALYKIAHDCDATLSPSSIWKDLKSSVKFDGAEALLNKSVMNCTKGGKISIIMDPVIALNAARDISDYNMAAFNSQMESQFTIGFIGTLTSSDNPLSLRGSGVLASPEYVFGESIETNTAEDVAISAGEYVGGGLATSAGTRAVGQVMMGVGTVVGKAGGSEAAGWSLCTVLRGAIIDKAGSNLLKGFKKSLLDPFALFGAIANFVIDHDSNSIENANKKGAEADRKIYDGDDAGNGINVVAVD